MENEDTQIKQSSEGRGNIQIVGRENTAISIWGIPLEKFIVIGVIATIVVQCLLYATVVVPPLAVFSLCSFWFPFIFGLPLIASLISGISLKNNNIIFLSVISGFLSILAYVVGFVVMFLAEFIKRLGIFQ